MLGTALFEITQCRMGRHKREGEGEREGGRKRESFPGLGGGGGLLVAITTWLAMAAWVYMVLAGDN